MARLYSNENFPYPVVEELRRLGHDDLPVQDAGKADNVIPDIDVVRLAASAGRMVLTLNRRHFVRLHLDGHPRRYHCLHGRRGFRRAGAPDS